MNPEVVQASEANGFSGRRGWDFGCALRLKAFNTVIVQCCEGWGGEVGGVLVSLLLAADKILAVLAGFAVPTFVRQK